uniref:Uncharacterized protein n=1 Tax=Stomoxys calcitrans TaxID=35570 RepID=A0A1I8NZ57_STOCA
MHPDFSLVLQKCASNLSLKHKQPLLFMNPETAAMMSCSTAESMPVLGRNTTSSSPSKEEGEDSDDLVRIVSDDDEEEENEGHELEEETQIMELEKIASKRLRLPLEIQRPPQAEEDDDDISMCSELSVGQEHTGEESRRSHAQPNAEDEEILDISDTHSNSSAEERNATPSTPGSADPINPFALANTLRFPVPFSLQAHGAPAVATVANSTSMSPFQEEFLRKSHLYAEELMKHQMQLMAAARASAFSLRSQHLHNASNASMTHHSQASGLGHINPLSKIGQISAAAAAAALTAAAAQHTSKPATSLPQQYQHLAHPQPQPPPHALIHHPANHMAVAAAAAAAASASHSPSDTLAKLTALSKQTTSSSTTQMMSTLNQLQTQMQAHLPGLLHDNNDNLHERALKFSIDNILKADFGRGQSPPQTLMMKKSQVSQRQRQKLISSSSSSAVSQSTSSMLNEALEQHHHHHHQLNNNNNNSSIPASAQSFSSSLASICTNSNDSNSTAVSSSYSSANGTAGDLVKSSPSQTPTLSPGLTDKSISSKSANEEGAVTSTASTTSGTGGSGGPIVWPAWVYCTRYSDRPSSGTHVSITSWARRLSRDSKQSTTHIDLTILDPKALSAAIQSTQILSFEGGTYKDSVKTPGSMPTSILPDKTSLSEESDFQCIFTE